MAEYFARFQLSIDLPCSLEVKAPTLQSLPLYIRPPAEMERLANRKKNAVKLLEHNDEESDRNSNDGASSNHDDWEGGDGFDEDKSVCSISAANHPANKPKKVTKAAKQRAEAELQRKKKIALICKAASTYKRRPDLKVENVAYSTQPIRRKNTTSKSTTSSLKNGPILEVGLIVFGPNRHDTNNASSDEEDTAENSDRRRDNSDSSAKLHVIRMVNGIPLLDSSESLACGVIKKVSNNASTWNSFGLSLSQVEEGSDQHQQTTTFGIIDSAQVAPFLKSTAHSLFQGDRDYNNQSSSSEEDDFDMENVRGKRKKKKESQVKCILPAALRLGNVLMVVQIQAKPSALPLPTLSKGRLPLNDKGISDALENGLSDCLRCLQSSCPGLLLTAQQLKKVERDVKYAPSAAGAIASVLCRSRRREVYDNVMNVSSGWDNGDPEKTGSDKRLETAQRKGRSGQNVAMSQAEEERRRVDDLRTILEKRLRFIVSDEFKEAKRAKEREKQRIEREELASARKRAKKSNNKTVESSDGMNSDCLTSGVESSDSNDSLAKPVRNCRFDSASQDSSDHNMDHQWKGNASQSSSNESNVSQSRRVEGRQKSLPNNARSANNNQERRQSRSPNLFDDSSSDDNSFSLMRSAQQSQSTNNKWKEALSSDGFGDGYESEVRSSPLNISTQNNKHAGNDSKCTPQPEKKSAHKQSLNNAKERKERDDPFSSDDSQWSSQFGEVVPGHFFR